MTAVDSIVRTALALAAALALATATAATGDDLAAQIRDLGLDPEEITRPLYLNDEMKRWVREVMPRAAPEVTRLKVLLQALQESSNFDFQYQAGYTGTAEEVFESSKFNCLSFSMLFVSLARDLGLPAFYLNLKQDQDYEKVGDLVVVSRHLTAGYGFVKDRTILEFDLGPEINYLLADPISDLEALALYYSNRGAEQLRDGQVKAAHDTLRVATTLVPDLAQAWVNLGVARRRMGNLDAAEEAYFKAVELERRNLAAYQNLLTLQRLRGRKNAAGEMIELLDRRNNHNPYIYLSLGDLSLEVGRVDEAERFFRRALRLARHEAETHAAMGLWALAAGKVDKAETWYKRAHEIDAGNERALELQGRLRSEPPEPAGPLG